MAYPLALRRAAGVLLLVVAAGTIATFVVMMVHPARIVFLTLLLVFVLPSLVALPGLIRVGNEIRGGRHAGDRLLFWTLVWAPFPVLAAFDGVGIAIALVATMATALVLYAVGTSSKYDWPDSATE